MNRPPRAGDELERALAARFARMRVEEHADAPQVPDLLPTVAVGPRRGAWLTAGLAAGVAVLAVLLVWRAPAQDPGEIYASIIAASAMATDDLMLASPGILPEVFEPQALYDLDLPAAEAPVPSVQERDTP